MSTTEDDNKQTWTTWDELLLAYAVKRHGCRNWDTVSTELQTRTKLPYTSPDACRLKFLHLRRRFQNLRRLRLDELRAEVNRHDVSIESLQSKVKKLQKDHREQSGDEKPSDLGNSNRIEAETSDQRAAVDGDNEQESDPENQSVNGSNSTGPNKAKEIGSDQNEIEPEIRTGSDDKIEPRSVQPGLKRELSRTSQDESSDSIDRGKNKKGGEGGGTKTDSDVQSSATLSRKHQRKEESPGASSEADGSFKNEESSLLINVLSLVRSHKDASFFESRPQIQDDKMYSIIVRQHMDLQTIQNNMDSGSYGSSNVNCFRDLILMFTNTIIFYPKSSPEYKAALELRSIVLEKRDEQSNQSQRSEEKLMSATPSPRAKTILEISDSLGTITKHKSSGSGPIVVCRKRSSISAKGNSTSKGEQHQSEFDDEIKTVALAALKLAPMEEFGLLNTKNKDRIVTGTRSLRRSNTSLKKPVTLPNTTAAATTSNSNKKEATITTAATTTISTEKKKEEPSASKKDDNSAKKRGAADFLKRLKGNSPVKSKDAKRSSTAKNGNGNKADGRRKITTRQTEQGKQTSKTEGGTSPTKRNVGRPSKKTPESTTTAGKRARDAEGSASMPSKQLKKRTKR